MPRKGVGFLTRATTKPKKCDAEEDGKEVARMDEDMGRCLVILSWMVSAGLREGRGEGS